MIAESRRPDCLSPETLARAAAGALAPGDHARVHAHLASCHDCYEEFSDLIAMRDESAPPAAATGAGADRQAPGSNVSRFPPATGRPGGGPRTRWLMIGGLAAAAALALAVITPRFFGGPDREINRALGTLAQSVGANRPALGRLSGDFAWGQPPAITRGVAANTLPLSVQDAVLGIRKLAAATRTARTLDAAGVAALVSGDIDGSLASLDEAVELDPSDLRARVDQSAARIEKWRRTQSAEDAIAALDAAQHAVLLDGQNALARFNHALSVEATGMTDQAIDSWNAYLALDASSKWADEARQHIATLKGGGPSPPPKVETLGDGELARAAVDAPLVLEHYLRDEWLPAWRSSSPPSDNRIETGRRIAAALRAAGRDRMWPDVVDAALATSPASARGGCIGTAARDITAARAAFDRSQTGEAERLARQAKAAFACAGLPVFEADGEIVWITFFAGQPLQPESALNALVSAAEARGYWRGAGRIEYIRGLSAERLTRLSDAHDHMRHALDDFQHAVETEAMASTWTQLGEIAANVGQFGEGWQWMARSLALLEHLEPRRRHIAVSTASLVASRQHWAGAAVFLADTLASMDARSASDATLLTSSFLRSADARITIGDLAGASQALDAAEQTRQDIADPTFKALLAADVSSLRGVVWRQTDPDRSIAALTSAMSIFDNSRQPLRAARLLLDRGRAHRAKGDLAAAERDWLTGMTRFEDTRLDVRDDQQRIDREDELWDLFRELISARSADPLRSLEIAERFRGRALLDAISSRSAIPATPLTDVALYNWLPAGTTALAYAVLPDSLIRWTITNRGVQVESQAIPSRALAQLVDRFRDALSSRSAAGEDATAGERLAALLLPATLPKDTARVLILPDAALFSVAFPALPLPGTSELAVDRYVVSLAPSLTTARAALAASRQDAARRGADRRSPLALLVASADAQPRESLPALPGAAAEIDSLTPIYTHPLVLTGNQATAAAFLRDLPRADVVHFAGHAIADPSMPSRSRLLLSPAASPGDVTFDELRRTHFKTGSVIVLSACDAFKGKVFRAEGAVGLAYPFLANGASSVVASLWQIDDATPALFWETFHRGLRAGLSPDDALAESQRAGRKAGLGPAIWAAFEAVGGLSRQ